MGILRSCYKSSMRIYRDRPDVLVPGRWCFCHSGAIVVPFAHAFGPSIWAPNYEEREPDEIGEVEQGEWCDGSRPPGWTGKRFCGTEREWQQGGLFSAVGDTDFSPLGLPKCCWKKGAGFTVGYGLGWDSFWGFS